MPSRSLLASLAFLLCLGACSGRGQLVLGLATDLPARGRMDRVTLEVVRTGEALPIVSHGWELAGVPALDFNLPGSFTLYAEGDDEPSFEVVVRGYLAGTERTLRTARLGILRDSDRFVRLGIVGACEDVGCPGSLTCIEGVCRASAVDPRTLPAFRAGLVERVSCGSGTTFIDTGTGAPMPVEDACERGALCGEGTCLVDPATLPGVDPRPYTGGAAELFSARTPPGGFFSVGAMDAARFGATASRLPDGRVLVVGGYDRATTDGTAVPVPGAVLYDPASARFARIEDPPAAIGAHSATTLADGTILFVGATAGGQSATFLYDPAATRFELVRIIGVPRYFHTATLLPNGKVLFAGGTTTGGPTLLPAGGAEVYDPSIRGFFPAKVGPVRARAFHTATALPDGRVLFAGGYGSMGMPLDAVEIYDPTVDEFHDEPIALRSPRAFHTATALSDGAILIVGGQAQPGGASLAGAELYAPTGVPQPAQPSTPQLARAAHQATLLPGDRVLLSGGTAQITTPVLNGSGGALLYDHATRAFSLLPAPEPRVLGFAVALADGDALLGGGLAGTAGPATADGGTPPMDLAVACDPVSGTMGCPAPQRCSISGLSQWGPRLSLDQGPRCVAQGSLLLGQACTATDDQSGASPDACSAGTVCASDVGSMHRCLEVCRYDTDCPQGAGQRSVCALIHDGTPAVADFGVCMPPCTLNVLDDCMPYLPSSCRLVENQAAVGQPHRARGACMNDGVVTYQGACARANLSTECSTGTQCINGFCEIQCSVDQACGVGTCTRLIPSDPDANGWCFDPASADMGSGT